MRYSCLHTHTRFCDGDEDVEDMCRAAYARGFHSIGFSSHAPLPDGFCPPTAWHLPADLLEEYAREVRDARKRWAGRIEVWLGLEIDFIRDFCGPADGRFDHLDLDYRIGSVHYLQPPAGTPFTVDGPLEEWEGGVRMGYDGDGEAAAEAYWSEVAELARAGGFDILGHLDLVKKNNSDDRWFNPRGARYAAAAERALAAVAAGGAVVEVNTGGLNRGRIRETYPSQALLARLRGLNVRITVAADAHRSEHLGGHYQEALQTLLQAGYSEQYLLAGKTKPPGDRGSASVLWQADQL